jgi:hypothetical protein
MLSFLHPLVFWLHRIGPVALLFGLHFSWLRHFRTMGMGIYILFVLVGFLLFSIPLGFFRQKWVSIVLGLGIVSCSIYLFAYPVPNMSAMPAVAYLWSFTTGLGILSYGNKK